MLLVLATLTLLPGCVKNLATGKSQFDFLSRQDEVAIGNEAGPQLTKEYGGSVPDPRLADYVTRIGMSLVEHTEGDYRKLPWTFTLLNSGVINAFSLPGGKVFISRALAEKFKNEAELAGVLGHEIGHVTAEHADRAVAQRLGLGIFAAAAGIIAGNDANTQAAAGVVVSGTGVFALTFSRDQENEADMLGMRYMVAAGYNPTGMQQVMQVLADEAKKGGAPPEWQSTHPNPGTRIGIIGKRLRTRYKDIVNDPKYVYNEARFRSEFLDPLNRLPAPPRNRR